VDRFFGSANRATGGELVHDEKHTYAHSKCHDPCEPCPKPRFSIVVIPKQEEREEGEEKHPSGKTGTAESSSFQAVSPDNELFTCVARTVQCILSA